VFLQDVEFNTTVSGSGIISISTGFALAYILKHGFNKRAGTYNLFPSCNCPGFFEECKYPPALPGGFLLY
jgi:hypothetical protein